MRKLKQLFIALFALVLTAGVTFGIAGLGGSALTAKAEESALDPVEVTLSYKTRNPNVLAFSASNGISSDDAFSGGRTIIVNGEEKTISMNKNSGDALIYFSFTEADSPKDETTSFKIPKGTQLGENTVVKDDVILSIWWRDLNGNPDRVLNVDYGRVITAIDGAITSMSYNNGNFIVNIETGKIIADDAWNNNKFLVDGKKTTINVGPVKDGNDFTTQYYVVIPDSLFGGIDNANEHTVVIPAGTAFGTVYLNNELKFYILGKSIKTETNYTDMKITGIGAKAKQVGSNRWYIELETEEPTTTGKNYVQYGIAKVKVGETDTDIGFYAFGGGLAFYPSFAEDDASEYNGIIPSDFTGKITIPKETLTTGGYSGAIKFTDDFEIAIDKEGNISVYKKYTATIKYGDQSESVTYDVFDRETALAEIETYFEAWKGRHAGEYQLTLPDVLPEENCEYEIKDVYTVTFKNGEDNYKTEKVVSGNKATKPATDPTKESTVSTDYAFDAWYNGDAEWNFETTVTENVTLDAKYTESDRKYSVKIGEAAAEQIAYGSKLTKPETDPTKAMTESKVYTFDGWYNGTTKWDFENDTVKGDVTLVAEFTESARKYNVTIVFAGIEQEQKVIEAKYNEKVDFADLAKDGYTLKLTVGEDEITELTVTGDVTVTATYTAVPVESNKGGCSGAVGMSSFACLGLLACATILRKKKD